MKRTVLNYIMDVPLLIQSFIVSLSGLILMYGGRGASYLGLSTREWLYLHEKIGIIMIVFSLLHVLLHWRWLVCTTKNFLGIKKPATSCDMQSQQS